jgi:hypothetical protein
MIRLLATALALTAPAAIAAPAEAGCYDYPATKVLRQYVPAAAKTQVTLLVDQSTQVPEAVRQQVRASVARLAVAGTDINIGAFSSYAGSRFPELVLSVRFEHALPHALDHRVSRKARDVLKACLAYQQRQGIRQLTAALNVRFAAAQSSIGRSDIMSSIQQFGAQVRGGAARDRVVVIVSDMLENSSATSFYQARRLRAIDAEAELKTAVARRLIADLGRARVYVIGMAIPSPRDGQAVPADRVQRLEQFWTGYFRLSKASRLRVGKPMLLEAIW